MNAMLGYSSEQGALAAFEIDCPLVWTFAGVSPLRQQTRRGKRSKSCVVFVKLQSQLVLRRVPEQGRFVIGS